MKCLEIYLAAPVLALFACVADPAAPSGEATVEQPVTTPVCTVGPAVCLGQLPNVTVCDRFGERHCFFESELPDGNASCVCSDNPQ